MSKTSKMFADENTTEHEPHNTVLNTHPSLDAILRKLTQQYEVSPHIEKRRKGCEIIQRRMILF